MEIGLSRWIKLNGDNFALTGLNPDRAGRCLQAGASRLDAVDHQYLRAVIYQAESRSCPLAFVQHPQLHAVRADPRGGEDERRRPSLKLSSSKEWGLMEKVRGRWTQAPPE